MIQKITACGFIYNAEQRLFVSKRAASKDFLPNVWELPGGHVEYGESPELALVREIQEEFGLTIIVEELFHAFSRTKKTKQVHTIKLVYLCRFSDADPVIVLEPEDHSSYAWIAEVELGDYFDRDDLEKTAAQHGFEMLRKR